MANLRVPDPLRIDENDHLSTNWKSFQTDFHRYINALSSEGIDTNAHKQLAILFKVIGPDGLALLDRLHIVANPTNDITRVMQALEDACCSASNSADEPPITYALIAQQISIAEFRGRCQQPDESFDHFYRDLCRLAQSCNFGSRQNEMLRDRIVDGICEPNTKMQLEKITNVTLANALGLCRMADMLRSRSTDTINGVVVPPGRDAVMQSGISTECVLNGSDCADKKKQKVKVENPFAMKIEHMCGISCWHPKWLQRFSNAKTFLIVYGLLGTIQAMASLYFVVTLTTLEKRFKIPSYVTGLVISGNEISQILFSVILSYAGGQRNRPRWLAWGVVFCAMSCFILALPHFIYGPGEDALHLTKEYQHSVAVSNNHLNTTKTPSIRAANKLCVGQLEEEECDEFLSTVPLVLIFASQFVLGIGTTLYYTLGQPYLDDNTKKTQTPMLMAYAMSLRMLGPVVGFILGFVSLRMYIDPWKTPLINNKDPRWLGAWWFGWVFLGTTMLIFSWLIGMFPKELPKMRLQRQESETCSQVCQQNGDEEEPFRRANKVLKKSSDTTPINDFFTAFKRVITNKVLMYNIISAIFYILSSSGFITFFSKYMEVQFYKSSADATIIAGPLTLIGMVVGLLFSGWFISKYQPSPRKLFMWNVIVGMLPMVGQTAYLFLHCESSINTMDVASLNLTNNCNANCFCDNVPYSPVCDIDNTTTFFSPCHAGCDTWDEQKKVYTNCVCGSNWKSSSLQLSSTTEEYIRSTDESQRKTERSLLTMIPGVCLAGCTISFWIFTSISCLSQLIGSTGRIGNLILNLRVVAVEDKSLSQGLTLMLISLFALIPGPILFGYIIDSTCLIWNSQCGSRGNCQLYDQKNFRYYLNITSMCMCALGVFFDFLVWCYAQNVDLYGADEERQRKEQLQQSRYQPVVSSPKVPS